MNANLQIWSKEITKSIKCRENLTCGGWNWILRCGICCLKVNIKWSPIKFLIYLQLRDLWSNLDQGSLQLLVTENNFCLHIRFSYSSYRRCSRTLNFVYFQSFYSDIVMPTSVLPPVVVVSVDVQVAWNLAKLYIIMS